ncbi:winged helix-turn-helix domain-containing protein [Vibrio europaeus]|uniref:winged helix-turn-helix domain-containing protein n=1 Tax=Vibrio europaeus TaxID=300876 RepID=UPI002340F48A|nr:winged helix-turn-helix domain-containing protein [Vibrio europaeus]MDC5840398.1 winged helix-turn-helix domain-containing protein [Vibrio europaeus]
MLLINGTHILDDTGGYIQSLKSQIRHPIGINEISLLTYMFSHKGKVLSKHELMEEVWHKRGIVVESSSLLHSISSCRRGLEDRSGEIIRTERGVGYEFIGTVKKITCLSEVKVSQNEPLATEQKKTPQTDKQRKLSPPKVGSSISYKAASVFAAAIVTGFFGTMLAKELLISSQYVAKTYNQCWYEPTNNGERIYYQNPTVYQFDELSLMLDEQGRSVSFSNQSGVVNCE